MDALAWTLIPLLVLALVPIGAVSGDGLYQSGMYAAGRWYWNPNHLLYEPLGAWWQATLTSLHVPRAQPDQLMLLSICAGALTLGIFRWGIAGPVAADRTAANLATAWAATCAAYATLWVSQETQMVQMPFLALTGAATVGYLRTPTNGRAAVIGGGVALATLFYISNVLLAFTLAVAVLLFHMRRHEVQRGIQRALILGLAAGLLALAGFTIAWLSVAPAKVGLLHWLTTYGGGNSAGYLTSDYGMQFTPRGVAVAVARAIYGSALAIVDVSPSVEAARSHTLNGAAVGVAIVLGITLATFAAAGVHLVRTRREEREWDMLLLVTAYAAAILIFGVYWNNSDDQFYFQLAIPAGVLMASFYEPRIRRTFWMAGGVLVLAWNAAAFIHGQVLYPRREYADALARATQGAGLVIYPGEDEVYRILHFVPTVPSQHRLPLTNIANRYRAPDGVQHLVDSVRTALAHGEQVDAVGVFDASVHQPPWKHLAEVGYSQRLLQDAIHDNAVECQRLMAGRFTVRSFAATGVGCATGVTARTER